MVTLMLLPGMDGTGTLFDPFVAELGPEFCVRVVRYPTDRALGYDELESIARAALPADGPFVILGESFSGPIAVSLAASHPVGLIGLVLCCSFVRNPHPIFSPLRAVAGVLPVGLAPIAVLSHFLLGKFSTSSLRRTLEQSLSQVSSAALRARLQAVLSVDVTEKLGEVAVPVLYLRALRDRVVPPAASALVMKYKPRTIVVNLEAPHFLLQTAAAEAARVVRVFVREVPDPIGTASDMHQEGAH